MDARELRPGLWRCALPHPEWTPEEAGENGWEEIVASYDIEASGGPVLFDPLAPLPSPELHRALVAGDVLLGTPEGGIRVCPDSWLSPGVDGSALRSSLRPLLERRVELVLLTHGEPVLTGAVDALARALEPHSPPSA